VTVRRENNEAPRGCAPTKAETVAGAIGSCRLSQDQPLAVDRCESGESMESSSAEKIVWPPVHLKTILVPTDLRPDSKVALSFALALAQKFEANLVLLHVFAEAYSSDTEMAAGASRLLDVTREDAERETARLEELLRGQYCKCRSAFRIGCPFEQILNEAAELKADLIVMASHCYGWFDHLVHGSDAERVLRQASCPVLIARDI
jgi:universal stress protein A